MCLEHSDDSVTLVLDNGAAFTGDLTRPAMAELRVPDHPEHRFRTNVNTISGAT